jgi:hypothetical protein
MIEGHHYQNAYVTRDIAKWVAEFRKRADVRLLLEYTGGNDIWTPEGVINVESKLAFVWVGDMQYELIEPISGPNIYTEALPDDDSLKFHHICNRVPDWDAFRARVDQQDLPIVLERDSDPLLKFLYLDARTFVGHYLEYVWTTDERWAQMGGQ